MKIGVFFHKTQADLGDAALLRDALRRAGAEVEIFGDEEAIPSVDRLIVLGGDGTVLRAARRAAAEGIPLFGINYGHTGFLTEFERGETEEAVALALSSSCDRIERSMLEVEFNGEKTDCLNECSLLRGVSADDENKVAKVSVRIDGSEAGEIVADGIIVATPTGSTAYSLSAGGSIMTPECDTFMLTPVCAFSMKSRPIVYSASSVLSFGLPAGHHLLLYGDGKFLGNVKSGDTVRVRKADRRATFLTRDKKSYFLRITEKIK